MKTSLRRPAACEPDGALDSRLYGLLHRGNPGDIDHYVRKCAGTSSVLELGCGRGRVLFALARVGHVVTGVERDPAHLAAARSAARALEPSVRARVSLRRGDIRRFRLARRFDRVIIPFNGLYCLLDDDDVVRCLERARHHLVREGRLLFDGYHVRPSSAPSRTDPMPRTGFLTTLDDDGHEVRVYESDRWDPIAQRIDVTYTFRARTGGGVRVRRQTIPHRYLSPEQIADLLARTGFVTLEVAGDFRGGPFHEDSRHIVVTAGPG